MAAAKGEGDQRVAHHVELEIKFDVPPGAVAPSFQSLDSVSRVQALPSQSLNAVYYDTPGHDLATNWVTLRRRTGGHDAGWHLKLPGGPDGRAEVRVPLETTVPAGPDTPENVVTEVPEDLVDVVRAIVRDRPLAPVAHICTTRTIQMLYGDDGTELAEFADDQVSAWRIEPADGSPVGEQRWHEWELEMVERPSADPGGPRPADLLKQISIRLSEAGAVPAGHGSKLAKVLGTAPPPPPPADPVHAAILEQIDELLVWDRAVRADAFDSVHQMRVITRKIRSLLQASEDAFGLDDDASILSELRELAAVLGVARDAEVLAERFDKALAALPPDLVRGPVRERLVGGAQRAYRLGRRQSLTAMRSPRYFRMLDALDSLAHEPPPSSEPAHKHAPIEVAYRRLRKAAAAASTAVGEDCDHALHQLRKKAKRLRYIAAAIDRPEVAEPAKTIQTLLGDHQDSVVSRGHLSEAAATAHSAGEDTFTYGLLYQQEAELARRSREQLDEALSTLHRNIHRKPKKRRGRAGL